MYSLLSFFILLLIIKKISEYYSNYYAKYHGKENKFRKFRDDDNKLKESYELPNKKFEKINNSDESIINKKEIKDNYEKGEKNFELYDELKNNDDLRRTIIMKEILDKPLSLRKKY
ncbi:hypothetical protein [uncultured Finegoldia sp.]|uniref:hypothetical protein n=1 Tax=uncultured Finegoldia sp. TaxID=328009 RepID=UPI00262E0D7F|nr:hypothetical protein [uncultured Finegoldia sp.]